jgi:hypothetical protein
VTRATPIPPSPIVARPTVVRADAHHDAYAALVFAEALTALGYTMAQFKSDVPSPERADCRARVCCAMRGRGLNTERVARVCGLTTTLVMRSVGRGKRL